MEGPPKDEKQNQLSISIEGISEERRKQLEIKLGEYEERFQSAKEEMPGKGDTFPPLDDPIYRAFLDSHYKVAVLKTLLDKGTVDLDSLNIGYHGEFISLDPVLEKKLKNAFSVIEDYVETGGEHNIGGTGL